jgi:CRISPR/Cas system-associated exonuclease Cas4 (RecB family)
MANGYWAERSKPYEPGQKTPFKVSRSKIELYTQCPRCFWLDVRLKIKRPSSPPFQINKAIDELFKKEFDSYRQEGRPHPIMVENDVKAVPFKHKDLDKWRHNFTGVVTIHKPTNLHLFGAVDDIWLDEKGELVVVDYKATAKNGEVNLDAEWQNGYKRQMEIYQWLLRQNGFKVSNTGYFVYANGQADRPAFNNRVEFVTKLIVHSGDDSWVEATIAEMKKCMDGTIPRVGVSAMGGECEHCAYAKARTMLTLDALKK